MLRTILRMLWKLFHIKAGVHSHTRKGGAVLVRAYRRQRI